MALESFLFMILPPGGLVSVGVSSCAVFIIAPVYGK